MARLDELERKFEENPRRYFAPLANEYRKAGDAAKAAELCRSQLPDVPGHISGHIVLGQALFDSGDFPGSRTALETALALDPENIVALRYLGDIARNTGDTAEAERWYSRTLEADPYNEAATQGLEALREQVSPTVVAEAPAESAPEPSVPWVDDDSEQKSGAPPAEAIELGESPLIAGEPAEGAEGGAETPAPAVVTEAFEPTAHALESVTDEATIELAGEERFASGAADRDEILLPVGAAHLPEVDATAIPTVPAEPDSIAVPAGVEERLSELAGAEVQEFPAETVAEPEAVIAESERMVAEPEPVTVTELPVEDVPVDAEFAGDLAISAASESAEEGREETQESADALPTEATATDAEVPQLVADETALPQTAPVERFDVEAHEPSDAHEPPESHAAVDAPDAVPADQAMRAEESVMESGAPEAVAGDEAMQAEERVMESAAPFVTETMADLYLEQGYPHEALELLLQLAEQRSEDERLREKVAHIESVIAARRDAVVAAARAERAETSHAADAGLPQAGVFEPSESGAPDFPEEAAAEQHDSSAFVDNQIAQDATPFEIPPFLPAEEEAPRTVREMFARMDRARPRPVNAVTPRPLSRLRSDFVPMPDPGEAEAESADDPFAFPDAPRPEQHVARTSGPHPTFNPSTADIDDFEAWLRGLKGP